ncbi:hypothetical protein GW626_18715 [Peribacillus muralis]|uniref:hypothetical protein n=1 Tax=Peribacillus muralis TaxID=264697 RepID=UPI001F4D84BD|nr:hypothetical protein [Peribacillus muralis]MCK1995144.1 hypothetical protein [Peribacillus muralis]MCK2015773.1 hypothetical protein [Peribacillus muralis]
MKFKKISTAFLTLVCVLTLPFSTALAEGTSKTSSTSKMVLPYASGGWDDVGSSKMNQWDEIGWHSGYVHSTGGDFLVCVDPANKWGMTYTLWEYDSPSYSKKVGTRNYTGVGCLSAFRGIGAYVDGDNKKAEFFISTTDAEGTGTAMFWD